MSAVTHRDRPSGAAAEGEARGEARPRRWHCAHPWRAALVVTLIAAALAPGVWLLLRLPLDEALRWAAAGALGSLVAGGVCLVGRQMDLSRIGTLLTFVLVVALCGLAFPNHYAAYAVGLLVGSAAILAGGRALAALAAFAGLGEDS